MKLTRKHAPFYIVSAYEAVNSKAVNRAQHLLALRRLRLAGVPYKVVQGIWRDKHEEAIVINRYRSPDNNLETNYEAVRSLARDFNQDAILYVSYNWIAFLVDPIVDEDKIIGKWTRISAPVDGEDHTYDPVTNTYWAVR